jgi:hypothetical protein
MTPNWLDLVPVVDGFAFNADLICEDCAAQVIEELEAKGVEDTGDSNDFPQGPYSENEADSPQHCGNHAHCVNAVQIPGAKKIGCPLTCTLTEDGVTYTRRTIAEQILFGSAHQKGVGRLWWHLFQSAMDAEPLLQLTRASSPLPPPVKKALPSLTSKSCYLLHEVFTDLGNLYGGAISQGEDGESLVLWRLEIDTNGKLITQNNPVQLPASELSERSLENIITDTISEGAWD